MTRFLILTSLLGLIPATAFAEGTDELMPTVGAAGRLGIVSTPGFEVFADIVDPETEVLCVEARGSSGDRVTVDVHDPSGDEVELAVETDGSCLDLSGHEAGAFRISNLSASITSTRRWDFSVCDNDAPGRPCDASEDHPNHIDGRVYSFRWVFNSTNTQTEGRSVRSSVYARVPIGSFGTGVLELQLNGIHGLSRWELLANAVGIDGINPSRSTREGNPVTPAYPIYLNLPDPDVEAYGVPDPAISNFEFEASDDGEECGVVEPGNNRGLFTFESNMPGRVRLICDLNDDDVFDAAGAGDFVLNGEGTVGENSFEWDGRTGEGEAVPAGEYECLVELSTGEFHYVAEDIEVAYPGLRMFQLNPALERTPLPMFWNDLRVLPAVPVEMPSGEVPSGSSPTGGLSSGPYADGAIANSTVTEGNARGWGRFAESGSVTGAKGDMRLMDTWTGLDAVRSETVVVILVGENADCDGTGGDDFEELCITETNPCGCDEDDECDDGNECTDDLCSDEGECLVAASERGTECAGGYCDGVDPNPMCEMCLTEEHCPSGLDCVDGRCVGDDDDMDTIPNLVECPDGIASCPDTDNDGTPDYQDPDDDDDGIPTRTEVEDGERHGNDVDEDGMLNWLDTNSDNAEGEDGEEGREDEDSDGIPDYLDPMVVEPPPIPETGGGFAGGSCSASGGSLGALALPFALSMMMIRRRRRERC